MRKLLSLTSALAWLAATASSQGVAPEPGSELEAAVQLVNAGRLQEAVPALEAVILKLRPEAVARKDDLVRALVYKGVALIGLAQEEPAKESFREALQHDPGLRLSQDRFAPRVVRVFDAARSGKSKSVLLPPSTAPKKAGIGALGIAGIVAGVAAIGGGVAVAAGGGAGSTSPTTPGAPSTPSPSGNRAPTVSSVTTDLRGTAIAGVTLVTLTAIASDPDGDPLSFVWSLGDGEVASGPSVTHAFKLKGVLRADVTVKDGKGGSATGSAIVEVGDLTGTWRFSGRDDGFSIVQNAHTIGGRYISGSRAAGDITKGRASHPRSVSFSFVYLNGKPGFSYDLTADNDLRKLSGTESGGGSQGQISLVRE